MASERREGDFAWAPAELIEEGEAPARKPRRRTADATHVVGTVIALLIVAGLGIVVWQVVALVR